MAKNSGEFAFEIAEHIATLSTCGGLTLELNRVSFGGQPAKLDLRKWRVGQPLKGVRLSCREATELCRVLPGAIRPDEESEILRQLAEKFGEMRG